jgi:hypothetical protein
MTKLISLAAVVFAAACGGSGTPTNTTPEPMPATADPAAPAADPAPLPEPVAEKQAEPPPPPPPPQVWKARASLAMVSGTKQAPAIIVFTETEGQAATSVTSDSWFVGLKPGKYHLVIHEGADCGKKAKGIGNPWAKAVEGGLTLGFEVTKDSPGNIDVGTPAVKVGGADTVAGHTLVLFDDKKGKAGKAVACGPITANADAAPAAP